MAKLEITESEYQALVEKAAAVEKFQQKIKRGEKVLARKKFLYRDELPTVESLKEHGITPDESCVLDQDLLAYLIYYAETYETKEGDYEYIYNPDPKFHTAKEIRSFEETRKYIEKVIIKCVDIVEDVESRSD